MARTSVSTPPPTRAGALGAIALGLVVAAMGGVPILAALDLIPSRDSDFGAPRPIVALLCSSFVCVGAMMIAQVTPGLLGRPITLRWEQAVQAFFGNLVALVFLSGGTAMLLWLVASPDAPEGSSSMTLGRLSFGVPADAGRFVQQAFLSVCTVLMVFLTGACWLRAFRGTYRWMRSHIR